MDADRLIATTGNPPNIIGIFHYCDRWCERCLFTERCLQYQRRWQRPDPMHGEEAVRLALEYVAEQFRLTRELQQRSPREDGDGVREHQVLRSVVAYEQLVSAWFESEREALCRKGEALVARAECGSDGEALIREATQIKNAIEIIEFDRTFVHAKLYRALEGRAWDTANAGCDGDAIQNDSNGSAKVALLSIDRSEAAWRLVAEWTGGSATAGLLADLLAQLRSMVEREFPNARRFVRPGFDESDR